MHSNSHPAINDVRSISSIKDPVIRNLRITQCYYELSSYVSGIIGSEANWCTFATWASRQAGQTIRKEDLIKAVNRIIVRSPGTQEIINTITAVLKLNFSKNELNNFLLKAINLSSVDRAGDSVARGNQKVFEEIGYEFARFIETCLHDKIFNENNINKFCRELKPGLPPDGQQYLRQAFLRYYKAKFEPDEKKKSELMLLANLEVGFHEQTRLQPEIADSLNAAVIDKKEFRNNLINIIFPSNSWFNKIRIFFMWLFGKLSFFDSAIESFLTTVRQQLRLIITEHLMTISFPPDLCINLGKDLRFEYPLSLKVIENNDLLLLLQKIDPTPDSLSESGAIDWADLPDRMHFITDMFRCFQQSPDLLLAPFSTKEIEEMKSGK